MNQNKSLPNFAGLFLRRPQAEAVLRGSARYPDISGKVRFFQTRYGVMVVAEISGLPDPAGECAAPVFAFHIHEGGSCSGNISDPFANAKMHYNPQNCPHPYHAGDLPPLFGANGYAFSSVLTSRFTVREIIGKTIIIHSAPDDFTSQPSGNSGTKIACGEITATRLF